MIFTTKSIIPPQYALYSILGLFFLIFACKEPEAVGPDHAYKGPHPFLIVKKEQFEQLRQRADTEPWKSMKADAITRSDGGSKVDNRDLQDFIGAAALAYILDEDRSSVHAHRVRDAILDKYSQLEFRDRNEWDYVVPPMGSLFMAILSLDIVYDALTGEEIVACEKVIADKLFNMSRVGAWEDVRRGTHGTWDIYTGKRTEPDEEYYQGIMHQVTPDGVSPVTIVYAWERIGGGDSRLSKSGYMDVLEFTGIDKRYYNNDRMKKFFRWLFGSSVTPARQMAIIGDMLPESGRPAFGSLHQRVVNFDMEAAAYASWLHQGREVKGNILSYILPNENLPSPQVPESKIYTDGGAFSEKR